MLPKRRTPTHPGEMLLKEFLEPLGVKQTEFCQHLSWTYARLNEIINKRRGVTADTALSFAEAFDMEPEFWLNLQRDWDLWHANKAHTKVHPFHFRAKGEKRKVA
jgi:addiction module HigA family antidote